MEHSVSQAALLFIMEHSVSQAALLFMMEHSVLQAAVLYVMEQCPSSCSTHFNLYYYNFASKTLMLCWLYC